MTRAVLPALLLATAAYIPFAGWAQGPAAPSAQSGTEDAIRVLLDQAIFWHGRSDDAKAATALSRVLMLDPGNADALAMQAQGAADRGDPAAAAAALAKLKQARPDDPRIRGVEQAIKSGPIDPAILAQARGLAEAGKPDAAVAAYRKAFKSNTPPPAFATEFYQAMAGTSDDWRVPRAGLAAVLRANPQDLKAQIAYAELLTYHDETRKEGIARLGKLAQTPSIAVQASKSLRTALFWLPREPASIPQYDLFLAQQPQDQAVLKLKESAANDPNSVRLAGYDALQHQDLLTAQTQFDRSLALNPNDSDALLGLALLRFQQKRPAEGRDLLKRVIALDPSKAEEFQKIADRADTTAPATTAFGPARTGDGGASSRRIRQQYAQVAVLMNKGEFAQAEALLRKLSGAQPSLANRAYLADIEVRAGHLAEAEAGYRTVLARAPRNVQALGGLAGVLARQGKPDEAEVLFAQAARLPGGAAVGAARADALRVQAQQMSDPVAKIGILRAAVRADPGNPWLRLELARTQRGQSDDAGADATMAAVAAGPHPSTAQIQAAVYYAHETGDDAQVVTLVDRLPPKDRTASLLGLRIDAQAKVNVAAAKALPGEPAERDRLLEFATQPDPTGVAVTAYGDELIRLGDKPAAREAVRRALAAGPATAEQRISYAGTLLGAGYPDEAKRVTQSVTPTTGLMKLKLAAIQDGAAVATSDKLNAAGNPAAAYDQLAPRLASAPDNLDLNLALSRLYASNQQGDKAVQITSGLLEQNPGNFSVRSSAVYAHLADGELGEAATLARDSTVDFPDDPQAWLDLANVERARGHSGSALRALETAKSLREKQRAGDQSSAAPSPDAPQSAAVEPLRRRYAQLTPAAGAVSDDAADLVTRRYVPYDAGVVLPIEGSVPAPVQTNIRTQMAQSMPSTLGMDAPAQGNPFHPGSSPLPTIDEPADPGIGTTAVGTGAVSSDAMTAQIDRGIEQVKEEIAPRAEGSLELRGRTGTPGLEGLLELAAPLEASYSPNGYGRLKVVVTPTYLYSGRPSDMLYSYNTLRYGTNALGVTSFLGPRRVRDQSSFGTGLDVGYAYDIVTADIGATPLGFREQTVIGGIELAPRLTQTMTLRLLVERRSVTDSILSFGGLKDYRTGESWGGVTRDRGHIQVDGSFGLFNYFAGAGGAYLDGHKVASNTEIDAAIGGTYPIWRTTTQEVRAGADIIYFGYNKNLSGFSLGQGGYFSPQDYGAILFPVTYRDQYSPDLKFGVGGSVGYQSYRSKNSDVFPNAPSLQAELVADAPFSGGRSTVIAGTHGSGVAGGANADIDYRVNRDLHIGAKVGFDRSGSFTEGTGLVYARYVFNDRT